MRWRLMRANLFKCKLISRISLHFILDPVQPLEYETGLLKDINDSTWYSSEKKQNGKNDLEIAVVWCSNTAFMKRVNVRST